MIVFVAGSIYIPKLFIKPQYSFIYTVNSYYYTKQYEVVNNHLSEKSNGSNIQGQANNTQQSNPKIYLYDIVADKSHEIPFSTASTYSLNDNVESPDGFSIIKGESSSSSFFPFYYSSGNNYNNFYIKKDTISNKLNDIKLNGNSYYDFRFLGWVNQ